MELRFLENSEFFDTKPLAAECFGAGPELDAHYTDTLPDCRIAAALEQGTVLSMVQLRRFFAEYPAETVPCWYLLYACTAPERRRQGYLHHLLSFVLDTLRQEGERFCFLVPAEPAVYRSLGFIHRWAFRPEERELLSADDGLDNCYACTLGDHSFTPPTMLRPADRPSDLCFRPFDAAAAADTFDFFRLRPNRSYDSVPLDSFFWSEAVHTQYAVADGRCLLLTEAGDGGVSASLPYCDAAELPYYFRLFERWFHTVLHRPFRAFLQDAEGVEALRAAGMLDGYEVTEDPEIFDYLYDGEALRTLAGRALAGKRNHIRKLERCCDGHWEYRTLGYENREEIIAFLRSWDAGKGAECGSGVRLSEDYSVAETRKIELDGAVRLLSSPELMAKVRAGGIYVDGVLCAFSLGSWNPREKMAVIEIEKAVAEPDGLYQLINREFLCHAFPDAVLVNREDDVGIPGLRKAKQSYHPIAYERRYTLEQKEF